MLYLNGKFVAPDEARVSALDRGSLFGDGVYEVVPVYSRRPFRLGEHLSRFAASMASIGLENPYTTSVWADLVEQAIALQSFDDQSVYMHVTRGNAGMRDFPFPVAVSPTTLIYVSPLVPVNDEVKAEGVGAISHEDFRWLRCDVKSLNLLPAVLMREKARRAGCAEAILFRDGWLTEGAASNIFVVQNGVILAPPKSNLILPGITYDLVVELAMEHQLPLQIRPISEAEVRAADEIWMTSSTKEILAIVELDGVVVGEGTVGPLARKLDELYQLFKQNVMRKA